MTKHVKILFTILVLSFSAVVPVYAQSISPTPSHSFFGEIASFFGNLFNQSGQQETTMQVHQRTYPMQGVTPGQPAPSGAMVLNPSGQPMQQQYEQIRLSRLVQDGKITQTQEQEILTELTSVQNQLKTWAQNEGINPDYVLQGPMMMGAGTQPVQSNTNGAQPGQMHPMFHYQQTMQGAQNGAMGGPQTQGQK